MGDYKNYLMGLRLDGNYEILAKELEEELERDPSNAIYWEMLADSCFRLGQLKAGVRAAVSALKLKPDNQLAVCILAICYLRLRDFPNCYNTLQTYFKVLDENYKWFLFEEFTLALDAGLVDLREMPIEMRQYAEAKSKIARKEIKIEADPEAAFLHFLQTGDTINAARAASSASHLFTISLLNNLVKQDQIKAFETMLRLGMPASSDSELEELNMNIKNAKSESFESVSNRYKIFEIEKKSSSLHALETVLNECLNFCFPFRPKYKRSILVDDKNTSISFSIGQLEAQTQCQSNFLPYILNLVTWAERFDEPETRDLYDMVIGNDSPLLVLTASTTDHRESALKYDSDWHLDNEFVSWNIWEVWTLKIMNSSEFLKLVGLQSFLGEDKIIAFNYLTETALDSKLQLNSEVYDRLKMSYEKSQVFRKKWRL